MRAVVALASLAFAGCGASTSSPPPAADEPFVAPLTVSDRDARADVEDRDDALRREVSKAVAERPLLQELPLLRRRLAVELIGPTSEGRVALLVLSDLPLPSARRAYRRVLARAGDDGRAYVPTFRRAGRAPGGG